VIAGIFAAILPDIDVLAFRFGIPYGATFGHRGFTHSIVFALAIALIGTIIVRPRSPAVFAFLFLCAMSHAVLDSMTNGGLGVAFFSPFSNERYFLPWRPIRVSPIGPSFFSPRGLATLASEVVWVWIPCVVLGLVGKYVRR
jgi:inner membrane protein